tara:strand:- start:60 stop:692 length:633 start_codon:yes stop_codon:yes gene_type:complete
MARTVRLTETELTRIITNLVKEETQKKKRKKAKKFSAREIMKGKITKDQGMRVMEKYNLLGSMKSLVSGYRKMYNKAPKWVQEDSPTPTELQAKIDKDYGGWPPKPDTDPKPAAFWILFAANVLFWYCYGAEVGWWPSDLRLKENINRTGVSKSGIPIYTFNYKNDDKLWSGTMAQDLLDMGLNEAVATMDNGYYAVNYNMIDVDMVSQN